MLYFRSLLLKEWNHMDRKKSILNVSVSLTMKIVTMIMALLVKRQLIFFCGNGINGLNALYLSIVGFLSVAELGLGTAITFCMYKPVVKGDVDQVAALYHLFRRMYLLIGGLIMMAGILLTPFLHYFVKDYTQLNVNIYFTFLLMLVSVALTYLFSAKLALFNAYKNNYITTAVTSGGNVLQYLLQLLVLMLTQSFVWYLICRIFTVLVQWLATDILARKDYTTVLKSYRKIDDHTKDSLIKSIKAMFMHKVGYVIVNSVDSIVISIFIGVVSLGEFSNYITILTSMTAILSLVFTSLTSVVGHLYVTETKARAREYCETFHLLNFALGAVFFLGYYAVIDDVVAILFSKELLISKTISYIIALNGFVQFMRQSVLVFRDATGTFYNDRWKPLAEGVAKLILSVLFVRWFGMAGVIGATLLTNLFICHIVEPYVLYKNAFEESPIRYYLKNYGMLILFACVMGIQNWLTIINENHWIQFFVNGIVSVLIACIICAIVLLLNRKSAKYLLGIIRRK